MNGDTNSEGPPRWVWRALAIAVVVVLGLTGWFVIRNSGHAARTSDDVKTLLIQGQQSSARADCRSAISAKFTEKRDARDNLQALTSTVSNQTFNLLLTVVFTHSPAGSPLTAAETQMIVDQNARLADQNRLLAAAQAAVDALPRLDQAVDRGYTLDNHHYPACPTVGG